MNTLLGELGERRLLRFPCVSSMCDVASRSCAVVRVWYIHVSFLCVLSQLTAATLNDVQYKKYRVAFKFRKLQKNFFRKSFCLKKGRERRGGDEGTRLAS